MIKNKWDLFLTCTFTYTYLLYIDFFWHLRLPTRHRMLPSPQKCLVCPLSNVKYEIFLSIDIFEFLRVISRIQADVFPTLHALHDPEHHIFISIESRARFARSGTSKISFYQDLWCFTHAITCASRCLPNCARFAQSGSFFRYYMRDGYLLPAGYVL